MGVIAHLIGFRIGITLALGREHMHQHRATNTMCGLESSCHLSDVMTIDGPHVGEAELLKNRAHFGHRQAAHAAFETVELCGEIATHERQVTHALLHAAGEELHRRAEPHPIQMTGESPDWRGNGHVVVIEHHQKGVFGM